jgi:5-enolpyruvylshikimate-3-phosphate synthase
LPFRDRRSSVAVRGGDVTIDASAIVSQFVSGLLLAGARYERRRHGPSTTASTLPSLPHIEMTVESPA